MTMRIKMPIQTKGMKRIKMRLWEEDAQGDYLKTLVYSNLYDKETQDYVAKAMKDAGLSEAAVDNLFFDFDSIGYSKKLDEKQVEKFSTIFGKVPTEMVQDTEFQLEQVKKAWKERGLSFKEGIKASMISVLFHDEPISEQEKSYLFVGHVGVLVPVEDGKFLFVEKLTFQEPYQAILFDSKMHVNDYLMNKYDTSWGQPTARPFIMENAELLEGYRLNPNTKEQ